MSMEHDRVLWCDVPVYVYAYAYAVCVCVRVDSIKGLVAREHRLRVIRRFFLLSGAMWLMVRKSITSMARGK